MGKHQTVKIGDVDIDTKLVNTILLLWERDIETVYCCQGGDGYIGYLSFKDSVNASLFHKIMMIYPAGSSFSMVSISIWTVISEYLWNLCGGI